MSTSAFVLVDASLPTDNHTISEYLLSPGVYAAIQASSPCVYCAAPAAAVDHVWPLARGGWEHESNLVPACKPCNSSKGAKLLTEWGRAVLVAHGVEHSPKVAAEWARLTVAAAQSA